MAKRADDGRGDVRRAYIVDGVVEKQDLRESQAKVFMQSVLEGLNEIIV